MFTFIIIALSLVALVAFLRSLTQEERSIVTRASFNVIGSTAVYSAKAVRATVKATYDIGSIAGMQASLEGQDTLNSMHVFNKDTDKEGGYIKVAVKKANQHSEDLGITTQLKSIAQYKAELQTKLKEAREARS